ncbi:MAG: LamG domain-containing protein [Kiritimatiellae bacterium]|nr:LamG domain-containing protein [Kiritimatiellia bacterium]
MKKLLAMTIMAMVACMAMPASAIYYVSHWDFGSDYLGEFDITGGNDLLNADGVAISNGTAVFDGTAKEFVSQHNVDLLPDKPYTIECFALAETDCRGMIMELSPTINSNIGGFYLYAIEGVMVRTTVGYNGEKFKNGTICDGQWHHIAVIVDPSTNVLADAVRLYVDGERQGVRSRNEAGVRLNAHRLYIGSRGGTALPFKGQIDDVRVTEGILSPSEFMSARSATPIDVRAYWRFDDGNALADSSGNGNTLDGSQGVTFADGHASFDGTASDVRTARTLDLSDAKDMTVEFFMRRHMGNDAFGMVMEHSSNYFLNNQGFYVAVNDYRNVGNVSCSFKFANAHRASYSPQCSVNSGWHHVAIVKDSSKSGTSDCVRLYVDGVRQADYDGADLASGAFMRNDYLYIGSRANGKLWLDADIDDVRITAQALAPGRFLRTRTGELEDVIAYWPFDDQASMLEDATGNGNELTGSGVTVSDDEAAVFDGSQSGFSTLAPLPLYAYESLTVEWFMKSSMPGIGIVMESTANYNDNPGAFCVIANDCAGYRMLRSYNILSGWSDMDGCWHHYALVYDWNETSANVVRLYRDGVQVATHQFSSTSAPRLCAGRLYIGTRNGAQLPFVGELDDIRITGRALSPAEFIAKRSRAPGTMVKFW